MTLRNTLSLSGSALLLILVLPTHAATSPVTAATVNRAAGHPILAASPQRSASVVRAQILLDRAHFSAGEIDGHFGGTMRGAVAAFNLARKINDGARVGAATWKALNLDTAPAIVPYRLTAEDVAGPFTAIPEEMADKAKLPSLGYESVTEALGEKFHVSPGLLVRLNPGQKFNRAGIVI